MYYRLGSVEHPASGFILGSVESPEGASGEFHCTISNVQATVVAPNLETLRVRVRFGVNILEGDLRVYSNGTWQRTELRTS